MARRDETQEKILKVVLAFTVIGSIAVLLFAGVRRLNGQTGNGLATGGGVVLPNDTYYVSEDMTATFYAVVVDKFTETSELVVYTTEQAKVSLDVKQTGFIDLDILNKTQRLSYTGTGRFYLDLSAMTARNVSVDNREKVVTIEIPHTKLYPVEIDPNQFVAERTDKGVLAFGEMRFTAQEYNAIERECANRIDAALRTQENFDTADRKALRAIKEMYEPLIQEVDDSYTVEVMFVP